MTRTQLLKNHIVAGSLLLSVACSSSREEQSTGGIEAALAPRAEWISGCFDSDRFGFSMNSNIQVNNDSFTRTNRYYSDGACTELSLQSIEQGTLVRKAVGGNSGQIDYNYAKVELKATSDSGVLALNTLSYCGSNTWQVNQTRDLTSVSGGDSCWERTPRTVRDIFRVDGRQLYFGSGSEREKGDSAVRPTALDDSRPWTVR